MRIVRRASFATPPLLMSTLHVIRLRGPWEYAVLAQFHVRGDTPATLTESTADLPPPGRIAMPADWSATLGAAFRGRVEYRRRFGRPTGISAAECVWLVCDGAEAFAYLILNGQRLGTVDGPTSPAEFDVTEQLAERNELVAVVECPHGPGGLVGEVRLEIRERKPK